MYGLLYSLCTHTQQLNPKKNSYSLITCYVVNNKQTQNFLATVLKAMEQ